MATYSQLQDRVAKNVIDLPEAVAEAIPHLVQQAHRKAQSQHNWVKCMKATVQAVTVYQQRLLIPAPTDFKEWRDKPYAVDRLGGSWELGIADDERAIMTIYGDQDSGRPFFLMLGDPDIFGTYDMNVWPLPDGISDYPDGEYRLRIPYWRWLPQLAEAGDHDWITDNLPEYITYHATREAFGKDWDEERMVVYTQKAGEEFALARQADKVSALSGVDTLVPVWRGYRAHRVTR